MADKRKAQKNAPKLPTVEEWAGEPVISARPITTGHQTGKLLLTFADGTKAIFKPA